LVCVAEPLAVGSSRSSTYVLSATESERASVLKEPISFIDRVSNLFFFFAAFFFGILGLLRPDLARLATEKKQSGQSAVIPAAF
jgi:hypothetical protein